MHPTRPLREALRRAHFRRTRFPLALEKKPTHTGHRLWGIISPKHVHGLKFVIFPKYLVFLKVSSPLKPEEAFSERKASRADSLRAVHCTSCHLASRCEH